MNRKGNTWNFLVLPILLLLCAVELLFSCGTSKRKEAEEKRVFRYNQAGAITSLDPAFASNQANIWATTQLYNGLVELDDSLKVVPSLASSWEVSEDMRTYTFHLREGIRFHDHSAFEGGKGREVTAFDFAYSFGRIVDTTGPYARGLWIFKDKVLKKQDGTLSDTCFKAVDNQTLKIYLQSPFPNFLDILTMPYTYVVPREVAEKYGREFRSHPVGTGPFQFKEWDEGNALIFLKNEDYWKAGLPKLDAVQISFVPDKGQAFRNFMMGRLDFVSGIEESSRDEILNLDGSFNQELAKKYTIERMPYLNTEYLGFQLDPNAPVYRNVPNHPFLNPKFRQAMSLALDKERMVTFLRNGLGLSGDHGIVPTVVPYFKAKAVEGYSFNPARARELLRESGVDLKTAPPLVLHIAKEHKALSEFLSKQWKETLGLNIQVSLVEASVLRQMAEGGQSAFFRASWLGDYPDGENYLALFYGKNASPNGPNKTRYQNEAFDSLFQATRNVLDPNERARIYEQLDGMAMADAPVIVLFYDEVLRLTQKDVKDLPANAMNVLKLEAVEKR